jgi:hypothetical protein
VYQQLEGAVFAVDLEKRALLRGTIRIAQKERLKAPALPEMSRLGTFGFGLYPGYLI